MWQNAAQLIHYLTFSDSVQPAATQVQTHSVCGQKKTPSPLSSERTARANSKSRMKLKACTCVLQEKHCPQEARCDSCWSSAVGRSGRSKILERRRCLSLSQSAPLGRLDCNGSSQSKRDLLATAGEPALTTRRTHFASHTRTQRPGELFGLRR